MTHPLIQNPGPWTSKDDEPILGEQAWPNIYDKTGRNIAAVATSVYTEAGASPCPADVALGNFIAAAPTMYATLLVVASALRQYDPSGLLETVKVALHAADGGVAYEEPAKAPAPPYVVTGRRHVFMSAAVHAGCQAVCVQTASGFVAWGFALSADDAERNAFDAARAIEHSAGGVPDPEEEEAAKVYS